MIKPSWRKPLPILVRINGEPKAFWKINMMPAGKGNFYMYLHGNVRKASDTKVGDRVSVEARFDPAYAGGPAHPLPVSFRRMLKGNRSASNAWEALSPSRKKEILRYFASLRSSVALERNVKRALEVLSGKSARFMARSWSNGT